MSKKIYLLDPGHGGIVNGEYVTPGKRVVFPEFTIFEGVVNRKIVMHLIKLMFTEGFDFVDVVASDYDVSLAERVKKANDFAKSTNKPTAYISIHCDAFTEEKAKGCTFFTAKNASRNSLLLASYMNVEYGKKLEELKQNRIFNSYSRGLKVSDFYAIKNTNMPAILIENFFMTNKEEASMLITDVGQKMIAQCIFEAIKKYDNVV